jgi:uncharacterized protein YkwD
MMLRLFAVAALIVFLASCATPERGAGPIDKTTAFSDGSSVLADTINRYRRQKGLAPVPVSASLTRVARAHVADLEANHRLGEQCNMHSWSRRGAWTSCCYTPDHAQAACMWNKPAEITGGAYQSPGYEIVAHYTDPMTPPMALEIWRESPAHHAMILNSGRWADNRWHAMGAAVSLHYAVVWFGEAPDRAGG